MNRSLPRAGALALTLVASLLLVACAQPAADDARTELLPMTVVEWVFPPGADYATDDPVGVARIAWDPMRPGGNTIGITLTDLDGGPAPTLTDSATLAATARALTPDAEPVPLTVSPDGPGWTVEAELPERGWYQLDLAVARDGEPVAETRTWALLPDPSVYGAEAVELPETDPDAEALYERALDAYAGWEAAHWRESLSSGAGAVVVSAFTVVAPPSAPAAMLMESRYIGAFLPRSDGSAPAPPRIDSSARITIDDTLWSRGEDGLWTERSSLPVATFAERADVYRGGTNVQPGGVATVNGVPTEIVTFYLPAKPGQSEAWFAWWIDPETGNPLRTMMIAQMHYMVWDFSDIDGDLTIAPPPPDAIATPVSTD